MLISAGDPTFYELVQSFGLPIAIFIIILFGGYKRWWVWGYQLKDSQQRELDWKEIALRGTLIAERTSSRSKWTVEDRLEYLEQIATLHRQQQSSQPKAEE